MVSSSTSIGIQGIILDNLVLRREGPDLTTQNGTPDGANMGRWLVPDGPDASRPGETLLLYLNTRARA